MKKLLHLLFWISATASAQAQQYNDGLKVLSPKSGNWTKTAARFESVAIDIEPIGLYSKMNITLELTAQGTNLQNATDSLELEYKFSLPPGSIIHEAWLWMNNIPVRATLYERDRARFIYESLVNRRIDPLIVYQYDDINYEARIFPLLNPNNRKIKLQILVPNTPTRNGWKMPLNMRMFQSDLMSNATIVRFRVANQTLFNKPRFSNSSYSFTDSANYSIANFQVGTNTPYELDAIYFTDNPAKTFYTLEQGDTANNWFYQLSLEDTITPKPARKLAFVVDYFSSTSNATLNISYNQLMKQLQQRMIDELTPLDSFLLTYANQNSVKKASEVWMPADSLSITNAFAALPGFLSNSSGTLTRNILDTTIKVINRNGAKASIILLTNGQASSSQANINNSIINYLVAAMTNNYPVQVFDFSHYTTYGVWGSNIGYWVNNSYMLYNLAATTGGLYLNRFNSNYYNYYVSYATKPFGSTFDLIMNQINQDLDYGFINKSSSGVFYNDFKTYNTYFPKYRERFMEVGQYIGGASSLQVVRYSAKGAQQWNQNYTIAPTATQDSMVERSWAKDFIGRMISLNNNNQYKTLIVARSQKHHVLCPYTAFLALEPDTLATGVTGSPTGITPPAYMPVALKAVAYPNPFVGAQTISCDVPASIRANEQWQIEIMDVMGRKVAQWQGKVDGKQKISVTWDASKNGTIVPGIYTIKIYVGSYFSVLKSIKQE